MSGQTRVALTLNNHKEHEIFTLLHKAVKPRFQARCGMGLYRIELATTLSKIKQLCVLIGYSSEQDGPTLPALVLCKKKNCEGGLRACLHGGGGPQVGEVTHLSRVTRLST